ncbi:MAG: phosphoribosylglycinamide formyltransferase [Negativicutes bacterium]|nr:phosphoribosylglycinamide formyltransferase [Negativicutes bacterium]
MRHLKIAALVSGSGRNLQSILDAIRDGRLDAEVSVVVASRPRITAIERAERYQIPVRVIPRKQYGQDIAAYSQAIARALQPYGVDLILLCGFLSFLSPEFCDSYKERIFNIHPSLLPAFGGKGAYGANVHQMVLNYGAKISGCTVMFVDAGEDSGPIILQKAVPVLDTDTAQTLEARVMQAEQAVYPEAVRLFGEGRLQVVGRRVLIQP